MVRKIRYFVFKPENFVKTDGSFVYSEKDFVSLVTICLVKKNVSEMKHQAIRLYVKGKLYSPCVMVLSRENGFKRFICTIYAYTSYCTFIC